MWVSGLQVRNPNTLVLSTNLETPFRLRVSPHQLDDLGYQVIGVVVWLVKMPRHRFVAAISNVRDVRVK